MAEFYIPPEWENLPPPELPDVDPDRIEGLQNGFLAATQDALHSAPDAFYRKTGEAAVEGLPALQEQLSQQEMLQSEQEAEQQNELATQEAQQAEQQGLMVEQQATGQFGFGQ